MKRYTWLLVKLDHFYNPRRTVVGVAYPGYRSLKALLTEDKADDMLWLRYWVLLTLNLS